MNFGNDWTSRNLFIEPAYINVSEKAAGMGFTERVEDTAAKTSRFIRYFLTTD